MQHDIVELLDAIQYAKGNFTDGSFPHCSFTRREMIDAFGKPYREDKVVLDIVTILAFSTGTTIKIKVIGCGDDVNFQKDIISGVINAHREGCLA